MATSIKSGREKGEAKQAAAGLRTIKDLSACRHKVMARSGRKPGRTSAGKHGGRNRNGSGRMRHAAKPTMHRARVRSSKRIPDRRRARDIGVAVPLRRGYEGKKRQRENGGSLPLRQSGGLPCASVRLLQKGMAQPKSDETNAEVVYKVAPQTECLWRMSVKKGIAPACLVCRHQKEERTGTENFRPARLMSFIPLSFFYRIL